MKVEELYKNQYFQKILDLNDLYQLPPNQMDNFRLVDIIPTGSFEKIKAYKLNNDHMNRPNNSDVKIEYVHGLYLYFTGRLNKIADCISGISHYQLVKFVESSNDEFQINGVKIEPGDILSGNDFSRQKLTCKIDEVLYLKRDYYVYKNFSFPSVLTNRINEMNIDWKDLYYKALEKLVEIF